MLSHHKNRINIKDLAQDIASNPTLAEAFLAEIHSNLREPDSLHNFLLCVTSKARPEVTEFLQVLKVCADITCDFSPLKLPARNLVTA